MTVRQAGAPITDEGLFDAARVGGMKNMNELLSPANKDGPLSLRDTKCRLYPKLSFFFDGTGNNLDFRLDAITFIRLARYQGERISSLTIAAHRLRCGCLPTINKKGKSTMPGLHKGLSAYSFIAAGSLAVSRRAAVLVAGTVIALSACGHILPDDPFASEGQAMAMVPINHTDRYATNIFVDKYWAGNVDDHAGGGAACCYPGLKDWHQPVMVRWTWGQESDPQTKVVLKKREQRTATAYFPPNGPHNDRDPMKDDAYVCVILRDLNTAKLAFSPNRSGCADK